MPGSLTTTSGWAARQYAWKAATDIPDLRLKNESAVTMIRSSKRSAAVFLRRPPGRSRRSHTRREHSTVGAARRRAAGPTSVGACSLLPALEGNRCRLADARVGIRGRCLQPSVRVLAPERRERPDGGAPDTRVGIAREDLGHGPGQPLVTPP